MAEKLEVVVIPVADPGRAKEFCLGLGLDRDGTTGRASGPAPDDAGCGSFEKHTGAAGANWPDWDARCMAAEQAGTELPR